MDNLNRVPSAIPDGKVVLAYLPDKYAFLAAVVTPGHLKEVFLHAVKAPALFSLVQHEEWFPVSIGYNAGAAAESLDDCLARFRTSAHSLRTFGTALIALGDSTDWRISLTEAFGSHYEGCVRRAIAGIDA